MKKHTASSNKDGFTLVEVMVSSFLTVIVLGLLFSVLVGTMNAWQGGTSRLETNSDARLAMDLLERDLQSLVARQTPYDQEWLVSMPMTVTNTINSSWLTFFSPSIDRDSGQQGDIVAISYRVGFQDPISTNERYPIFGMYKVMSTTTNTFVHALGKQNIIQDFWQEDWGGIDPDPSPDPLTRTGLLVPNVVEFSVAWWISYIDTSGSRVTRRFGPDEEIRLSNVLEVSGNADSSARLESADISLTFITNEGMQRFRLIKQADQFEDIKREFGRTHTIRVPINY